MTLRAPEFDGSQACYGSDPEAWFPQDNNLSHENRTALRICLTCPEREPCLDYALRVRVDGIWGGTTASQRQRIRKQRNINPLPVVPLTNSRVA